MVAKQQELVDEQEFDEEEFHKFGGLTILTQIPKMLKNHPTCRAASRSAVHLGQGIEKVHEKH